jgi:uncharacterized protein (DUF1800 family)
MRPHALRLILIAFTALLVPSLLRASGEDTVSLVLIEGDVRQDWPDPGSIALRRKNAAGDLEVYFTLSGSALSGTDYQASALRSVTIPDGDREAWVQIHPTGATLSPSKKSVVLTLQSGSGYNPSALKGAATVWISNGSPKPGSKAAIRFLEQAAFGPEGNFKNVQEVMRLGFEGWLSAQFSRPVGLHQPYLSYLARVSRTRVNHDSKTVSWWNRVMGVPSLYPGGRAQAPDPLRQRVAFALSEIFVISDRLDELSNQPIGMMHFYDLLVRGAFGNYRDVLYQVGAHPCMGIYLTHLQNEKGDPEAGTFADENFAREIMQLFSVGLWELNQDGTRKRDAQNQPIPTYDNHTIAETARVMTGFSFGGKLGTDFWYAPENFTAPMRMWDEYHDTGAKTLIGGVQLPARTPSFPDRGTAGLADYAATIDALFQHPNTPPFVCSQLIQKLVTSNPSPAYVARVAGHFIDNGRGVRGDLKSVVRAILLDPEARDPERLSSSTFGKLKEPYLRTVQLAKAVGARAANGNYELNYLDDIHFQQPLSAPSVFNFFKPAYSPAGPVADAGLLGPEFQILNDISALSVPNYHLSALSEGFNRWGSENPRAIVRPHLSQEIALAKDVPALLRRLDLLLTGGTLPNEQHQLIREAVEEISTDFYKWREERVRMAIYLIASSAEFALLR